MEVRGLDECRIAGAGAGSAISGISMPQPLSILAEANLLNMADVAFLSQVPTSTLSRLWSDESWLDGITGVTLQRLISALPNLTQYIESRSQAIRLEYALHCCTDSGLAVRQDRIALLLKQGQSAQYLATALEAEAGVMRGDSKAAVASLARCWGAKQSAALDMIVTPASGVIVHPEAVVEKALRLMGGVNTSANCLHTTVGYGILVHKLTKLTGRVPADISPTTERSSAFSYRSGVIGILLRTDDLDAAIAYHRELESSPLLQRNEVWSLGTFAGDIPQTPQLTLSGKPWLSLTAANVIADIANLGDAYLYYLATTAVPVLLSYDPIFGSAKAELAHAINQRMETGIRNEHARKASIALISSLR